MLNMIKKLFAVTVASLMVFTASTSYIRAEEDQEGDKQPQTYASTQNYFSVNTAISDSSSIRTFIVTNITTEPISNVYYEASNGQSGSLSLAAGEAQYVNINVGNSEGASLTVMYSSKIITMQSNNIYNMPVRYLVNGSVVKEFTVRNYYGSGAAVSAPASITVASDPHGKYLVNGNNYKRVAFGTPSVEFTYSRQEQKPFKSTVKYVDQDGNGIGSDSFTVTEAGGNFSPKAMITAANGRSYKLMSGQGAINQTYTQGARSYTFRYQLQEDAAIRPYFITVRYVADGQLLNAKTYTLTNGKSVKVTTPATYTSADGIEYVRKSGEETVINHAFATGAKTYTIAYEKSKADSNNPYNIRINYIDLLTGRTISSKTAEVGINKTVNVSIDSAIKDGNTNYTLASSQPKTISHKFGSDQRTYNVYYTEKGKEVENYNVDIVYFDITNNKVLSSRSVTAEMGKEVSIHVPKTVSNDGTSYALLSGQSTETKHSFYSSRRRYVYFYRDVEDTANENTVVTPTTDGTITVTPAGNNTVVRVNPNGNMTVQTPNGTQTLNEDNNLVKEENNETPKTDGKDTKKENGSETVKDNTTPKSEGKTTDHSIAWIAGGCGAAIALLGLAFFFVKRKKDKKEAE